MAAFVVVAVIAFMVTVAVTVMVAALVAAEPAVAAVALVVVFTRAPITFMLVIVVVAMLAFMATIGQGGTRGAEQDDHQPKDKIKETLSHVFPPDLQK
jgi:uncharacterized membrane protein